MSSVIQNPKHQQQLCRLPFCGVGVGIAASSSLSMTAAIVATAAAVVASMTFFSSLRLRTTTGGTKTTSTLVSSPASWNIKTRSPNTINTILAATHRPVFAFIGGDTSSQSFATGPVKSGLTASTTKSTYLTSHIKQHKTTTIKTLCEGKVQHHDARNIQYLNQREFYNKNRRSRNTSADRYFQQHHELPKPKVMHARLDDDNAKVRIESSHGRGSILVIGDVHGCFDELQLLYQKAQRMIHPNMFQYVILVGDLCNKGPHSAKVIRWMRWQQQQQLQWQQSQQQQQRNEGEDCSDSNDMNGTTDIPSNAATRVTKWLAVRGNHDDGALAAALGDDERRSKKKYQWVMDGEGHQRQPANDGDGDNHHLGDDDESIKITLSDEDVEWLAELPYTITIPGNVSGEESFDTVVVHAGLIPKVKLHEQTIETMITVREVEPVWMKTDENDNDTYHNLDRDQSPSLQYKYHLRDATSKQKNGHDRQLKKKGHHHHHHHHDDIGADHDPVGDNDHDMTPLPWAQVWKGPPHVIFGHDARRGLQQHEWAIGLDTGAVYGKQLTGIILPSKTLVSVDAVQTHSPVIADNTVV